MATKTITIVGATGQQGGSVINAILSHPILSQKYQIRAITRDPTSPSAHFPSWVTVVRADLDDPASLESAFKGSFAVFGVTDYWARRDVEYEIQQGKNIADAAKASGVSHLIWSSSTHVARATDGRIADCKYFDGKAEVEEYIETMKGDMAVTYVLPGIFMQMVKKEITMGLGGNPVWLKPWDDETRVPYIDAWDSGLYVAGALLEENHKKMDNVHIRGVSQWLNPREVTEILSRNIKQDVRFLNIPVETYRRILPDPVAPELVANMVWVQEQGYFGRGWEERQAESDKYLGDMKPKTWETYIKKQSDWTWN